MRALTFLLALFLTTTDAHGQSDSVDHYGPYLVLKSGTDGTDYIGGVSTFNGLSAGDTLNYWLTVIDTIKGVTIIDNTLGIRFSLALQMRAYGLWVRQDPQLGPHWELYDLRFRKVRDLPLVITRIIEIPFIKKARRP